MLLAMLGVAAMLGAREARRPAPPSSPRSRSRPRPPSSPPSPCSAPPTAPTGRKRSISSGIGPSAGCWWAASRRRLAIGLAAYARLRLGLARRLGLAGENQGRTSHMSIPITVARLTGLDPDAVRVAALVLFAALVAYLLALDLARRRLAPRRRLGRPRPPPRHRLAPPLVPDLAPAPRSPLPRPPPPAPNPRPDRLPARRPHPPLSGAPTLSERLVLLGQPRTAAATHPSKLSERGRPPRLQSRACAAASAPPPPPPATDAGSRCGCSSPRAGPAPSRPPT